MDIQHRIYVVSSLNVVNETMEFEDDDKGSANNLLICLLYTSPSPRD